MKKVILTGLRANNDLHIGNYLGALLPFIDMAKSKAGEYQLNLFMPDLHSITTPIDHSKLQGTIMDNLKVFAAAGLPLDNSDIYLYRQSYVPAHSELTVLLNNFTGFGEMGRMTQFKDKSQRINAEAYDRTGAQDFKLPETPHDIKMRVAESRVSVGLFDYPVLMACDILLYNATYVPVGDDQSQHLEFTRDIAIRMNAKFGDLFTVPVEVKKQHEFFGKDQGLRIKDLLDPSKKMSKSDETGKGVIFMTDSPEVATKKIMAAATDSIGMVNYDPVKQPGISNLLQILALLTGKDPQETADEYSGQTQYGDFKKDVAKAVADFLTDFQAKLAKVDNAAILAKLEKDEAAMREQANATLLKVQQAVGLRPKA
jgi:tryptophanyl-tRNA synthetase